MSGYECEVCHKDHYGTGSVCKKCQASFELKTLKNLVEKLKQEAQIHAMEADTQKGIVLDIYKALGIQQGDWNGKKSVVEIVDQLKDRIARLEGVLTPELIDLARCGIRGNYGGSFYEQKIEQIIEPAKQVLNESDQQSLVELQANAIENWLNNLIERLFVRYWTGDSTLSSIENMRKQLHKNLSDQLNGYWSGHSAYTIMIEGGFLINDKHGEDRKLTLIGELFMSSYGKRNSVKDGE